jgi:NAD-dependent DNA ligase
MTEVASIVSRLDEARRAYHNGLEPTMTDEQYDALVDRLEELDPTNPFLTKVGAPIETGDEVTLPIPLPSLNKAKPGTLAKWISKNPAPSYMVSAKLDGCSALWLPETRQLYTRGDGVKGRNISAFVPYFRGLPVSAGSGGGSASGGGGGAIQAIRGELIIRTDSAAVPAGKLARNIVAGILNRDKVDPELFREVHFVAYELVEPSTLNPKEANTILKSAGFDTARATMVKAADLTEAQLSAIFDAAEKASPYQMDGIVVAPDLSRAQRPSGLENPTDRVAWKQRGVAQSRRTTVREVEWNVSHTGYLIPRVLFDEVTVGGANIHAATGLHGRWIFDNGIGPGAVIEIKRAGDTIPQIVTVHSPAPGGPAMPAAYEWISEGGVHIRPAADANTSDLQIAKLAHALGELGAEHVGPGVVAKLYDGGFRTVGQVYAASPEEFASRLKGVKAASASKIYEGLRSSQSRWTELDFMVASSTMPRLSGRTKLTVLLAKGPPTTWDTLIGHTIPSISHDTLIQIVGAVPAYMTWRHENLSWVASVPLLPQTTTAPEGGGLTVVLTGERDQAFIAALVSKGHVVASSVTKKTTAVVYPDSEAEPTSSKVTKAKELGIPVLTVSAFTAKYLA